MTDQSGAEVIHPSKEVAFVTGAAGDFGQAIVQDLAAAGWYVAAGMRDLQGHNAPVARDLQKADPERIFALEADVNSTSSVNRAVAEIMGRYGRIDVAVNNAGKWLWGPLETQNLRQARELFETNVFGMLRVIQAVVPIMREQRSGLLIYISSGLGRIVRPGVALYAGTKWSGEGIAQTLRYELAPFGIDSVIVEPGAFETGLFDRAITGTGVERDVREAYGAFMARAAKYGRESDVHLVSGAVVKLAKTPTGRRPMRTAIGMPASLLPEYNEHLARVQKDVHDAAGSPDEMLLNGY